MCVCVCNYCYRELKTKIWHWLINFCYLIIFSLLFKRYKVPGKAINTFTSSLNFFFFFFYIIKNLLTIFYKTLKRTKRKFNAKKIASKNFNIKLLVYYQCVILLFVFRFLNLKLLQIFIVIDKKKNI